MNTLIINASPRKNGKIHQMLLMAQEICGDKTQMVDLYQCNMKYCIACMACRTKKTCALPKDDAQEIAEQIKQADLLIIGSPTHWGNMSSPLKTLFDRTVYVFMGESHKGIPVPLLKGKKAIIVTTCTTPFPFNLIFSQSRGTVRSINEVLHTAGIKTDAIQIAGTKKMKQIPEKYIERMTKLILKNKKHFQKQ